MQLAVRSNDHLHLCGVTKYNPVTTGKKMKNARELKSIFLKTRVLGSRADQSARWET
jgi:hypothetical protein